MKFGDFLEEHLISEWRTQYLDYNKGKLKLKKLKKFLDTSAGCRCSVKNEVINDRSSDLIIQINNFEIGNHPNFYSETDDSNCDAVSIDSATSDDLKVVSLVDELATNQKEPLWLPTLTSNRNYGSLNTQKKQRSHSTSVLYIKNSQNVVNCEEENILHLAKEGFMNWVDAELCKVDNFFCTKERACLKRFFVLLNQIEQLKHHENYHTLPNEAPGTYATSDLTYFTNTNNPSRSRKTSFALILDRLQFFFDYFQMPSKPKYFWKAAENTENLSPQNRETPPPPFMSKIMIKKAICELYHKIELLNSFKSINTTAFEKLIKKYDKNCHDSKQMAYVNKVNKMYFNSSDILSFLADKIEEIFAETFQNGDRKIAVAKLRSFGDSKTYYRSSFISGYLLGVSCPLLVCFLIAMYSRCVSKQYPNEKFVLQLWGSLFLFVFAGLLFAVNCYVWESYKINYKLVFELNSQDAINYKQFLVIPSALLCGGALLAYVSTGMKTEHIFPSIYFYIIIGLVCCPFNVMFLKARIWFLVSIFRLFLSGFYPVEFRDFFMGVITCSLTYSISNIFMLYCLQTTNWLDCPSCGPMKSHVLGLIACIPPLWRAFQCSRRFLDTGDWFPHFANLLKYLITTAYFCFLSFYRIGTFREEANTTLFNTDLITGWFIFIALINAVYSSFWDIFMDWSLMQSSSDNLFLRNILIYKKKRIYYAAIVFNIAIRFQWVVYVFPPYRVSHSALTAFLVAVCELLRRFVWLFFRMENEHVSNVINLKVLRDCALPYQFTVSEILASNGIRCLPYLANMDIKALFEENEAGTTLSVENSAAFENSSYQESFAALTDIDVSSIYTSATQRTDSGWNRLSKIISKAHTKEFQPRQNLHDDSLPGNVPEEYMDFTRQSTSVIENGNLNVSCGQENSQRADVNS